MTPLRFPLSLLLLGVTLASPAVAQTTAASAQTPPAPAASMPRTQAPAATAPRVESGPVEADPIRCWWRSSTGAVRTGETFSVVLTCAVLETEMVQIVPDESRLGSSVIAMAPFEIVGGTHPADLRTANRRFFQYEYNLRMINPDFIGKDVRIPDLAIHFRVNSKLEGSGSIQGRDLTYMLPTLAMRILSMVPAEVVDIRDASDANFDTIEALGFRASLLRIVAITLFVLGGLIALISLIRMAGRARLRAPTSAHELSAGSLLRSAGAELAEVQRESEQGWNDTLAGRALAATRIVAAEAIGRPSSQRIASRESLTGEGQIVRAVRRGKGTAVWSTVTAEEVALHLMRQPASAAPEGRQATEDLQAALALFTATQYTAQPALDRSALDAALARVIEAARTLQREHAWPKAYLKRWRAADTEPERRP